MDEAEVLLEDTYGEWGNFFREEAHRRVSCSFCIYIVSRIGRFRRKKN